MQLKRALTALPLALALCMPAVEAASAGTSQAATAHSEMAMRVTKTGTFEKLTSMTSFKMSSAMKTYTVKVNDMTHITYDGMKAKLSSLKKGDTVTVKGELEMGTIIATSVAAGM